MESNYAEGGGYSYLGEPPSDTDDKEELPPDIHPAEVAGLRLADAARRLRELKAAAAGPGPGRRKSSRCKLIKKKARKQAKTARRRNRR